MKTEVTLSGTTPKKHLFGTAVLCLGALLCQPVFGAAKGTPSVKVQGGKPVLVLPEDLKTFLGDYFPDYQLPGPKDLTGDWAQFKKEVPYAAWGDYNGDGLTDVALILFGRDRWRLVELHKTSDGFYEEVDLEGSLPGMEEFSRSHAAQEFRLFTVAAGKKLVLDKQPVEASEHVYDSVAFFSVHNPADGMLCKWLPAQKFHSTTRFGEFTD